MTAAALVCGAIALWVSAGTLAITGFGPASARTGLLPSPGWLAALVGAALALAWILRGRATGVRLLFVSSLTCLPWLPGLTWPPLLIWTGPLRLWLWAAVAVAIGGPLMARRPPAGVRALVTEPARATRVAAVAAFCVYLAGAWQIAPRAPGGDEPHYLVITQSLLVDRDLQIENNHARGDYTAYFGGPLKPDYMRRGQNQAIYSIHAPGLPALISPAFALVGYAGVVVFLAAISAAAAALTWTAVWRVTANAAASWFGWSAVALSTPFFFQAFAVYPDATCGALVMVAVVTLTQSVPPSRFTLWVAGTALAVLPWLHSRFAVLAAAAGLALALRVIGRPGAVRRLTALLAVPAVSALAWFAYFWVIYGTPSPTAPYGTPQMELGNLVRGVPGLLFDQQFGLLPNAPVYLFALVGFVPLLRRDLRLGTELLALIVPYCLVAATLQMWWAGASSPARFLVPILLPLAVPAGVWFASAHRSTRAVGLGALLVTCLITSTLAGVDRGVLVFNVRDGASRLLLWLSPAIDLTTGLPSLFRTEPSVALLHAAIWLAAGLATWGAVRLAARPGASAGTIAAVAATAAVASGSLALSLVWWSNRAEPIAAVSGAVALLNGVDPDARQIGVRYAPLRRVPAAELISGTVLAETTSAARAPKDPLLYLPFPVAATYEIDALVGGMGATRLDLVLDRQSGPAWSWSLREVRGPWRATVTLPTPVRALLLDGDAVTRAGIDRVSLRAVRVLGRRERLTGREPRRAVRYGPALLLLIDGHAYVEREGTWVAGGGDAEFAIEPDHGTDIRLFVRNAAVQNRVTIESGTWRRDLALQPREERFVDLPFEAGRPGLLLRVSAETGARPADVEPGNADRRLLGAWIETR
jgi:hypothetical protein